MVQTHTWNVTIAGSFLSITGLQQNHPPAITYKPDDCEISFTINNSSPTIAYTRVYYEYKLPGQGTFTEIANICPTIIPASGSTPITYQMRAGYSFPLPVDVTDWAGIQIRVRVVPVTAMNCLTEMPTYAVESTTIIFVSGPRAELIVGSSTFVDTATIGVDDLICSLVIRNTGLGAGGQQINYKAYINANGVGGTEHEMNGHTWPETILIAPNSADTADINWNPNEPIGSHQLGVKVWAQYEDEPSSWSLLFNIGDNQNILIGLIIVGSIAGLLWYTKKKKMW